MAEAHIFK